MLELTCHIGELGLHRVFSILMTALLLSTSPAGVFAAEADGQQGSEDADAISDVSGPDAGIEDAGSMPCTPGTNQPCTCADGSSGTEMCGEEGDGFEPCVCDNSPDTADASEPPDTWISDGDSMQLQGPDTHDASPEYDVSEDASTDPQEVAGTEDAAQLPRSGDVPSANEAETTTPGNANGDSGTDSLPEAPEGARETGDAAGDAAQTAQASKDSGGESDDGGGCAVTNGAEDRTSMGLMLLALVGLLVLFALRSRGSADDQS